MLIMHKNLSFIDIFLMILLILQTEILLKGIHRETGSILHNISGYSRQIPAKGDNTRVLFFALFVQNEAFFSIQITSDGRGEVSGVTDGKQCNLCWTLMTKTI
jgi:hypothetical protein